MVSKKEMFRRIVNLEVLCAGLEDRIDVLLEVKKPKTKKTVKKTK